MNLKYPKLLIVGIAVLAVVTVSITFSNSYSLNNPLEFSEIMKQKSGYSTITISGESSTSVAPDAVVMTLGINNPPTDLRNSVEQYNKNAKNISDELKQKLQDYDDVTLSYIQTNFDGNHFRYGGSASPTDSYVAYMSFPIKVDMNKYQKITQEITNLGLRIEDIRVSKIPTKDPSVVNTESPPTKVSVAYDSAIPSCETTNECFLPADITVNTGAEVIWSNDDQAAHTITSGTPQDGPDGFFDSSLFMAGTTFSHVFDVPGDYPYFCLVHPWMVGSVTVLGDTPSNLEYTLEATINVRYETKPDTLEKTLSAYAETLDKLSELLGENGVSGEIPKSTININPSFYQQEIFDSYQTSSRWTVKTTMDNLDDVHGILSKYGGIERMCLSYSKSSIDTVRQKLTQDALDDARKNVMEIIEPMNLNIKGIKNIKINQDFDQQRNPQMRYDGVLISYDEWNNIRDGNISILVDVEFEVGP